MCCSQLPASRDPFPAPEPNPHDHQTGTIACWKFILISCYGFLFCCFRASSKSCRQSLPGDVRRDGMFRSAKLSTQNRAAVFRRHACKWLLSTAIIPQGKYCRLCSFDTFRYVRDHDVAAICFLVRLRNSNCWPILHWFRQNENKISLIRVWLRYRNFTVEGNP